MRHVAALVWISACFAGMLFFTNLILRENGGIYLPLVLFAGVGVTFLGSSVFERLFTPKVLATRDMGVAMPLQHHMSVRGDLRRSAEQDLTILDLDLPLRSPGGVLDYSRIISMASGARAMAAGGGSIHGLGNSIFADVETILSAGASMDFDIVSDCPSGFFVPEEFTGTLLTGALVHRNLTEARAAA